MPGAALLGVKFPLRLLATLVQWYELHHSLSLPSHYAIFGSPKWHGRHPDSLYSRAASFYLVIHSVPQGNAPNPAFVHGRR